jgi:hypothetical protein
MLHVSIYGQRQILEEDASGEEFASLQNSVHYQAYWRS